MKKIIFLLFFQIYGLILFSNPVSVSYATQIALNYFEFLSGKSNLLVDTTHVKYYNGSISYYIICFSDGGYVYISSDNAAVPILGYSLDAIYDESDLPPAYLWWMEKYSKEIEYIKQNNLPNDSTILEWTDIETKNFTKSINSINPLVTSLWGQSTNNSGNCGSNNSIAYNKSCLYFGGCNCNHCAAGCVAVAMAQVMRKWQHPAYPTYSHYDWCNMPNELYYYSDNDCSDIIEADAIAKLIADCGDKAEMGYCDGPDCSSSSYPWKARNAFVDHFGYSSDADLKWRIYYLKKKWIKMLKDDLDFSYPLIYSGGETTGGGHTFVIDGYSDNNFHINWGWKGYCNGYYAMGALNADNSSFNQYESAIFNLHPNASIDCSVDRFICLANTNNNPVGRIIISPADQYCDDITILSGVTASYQAYQEIILQDGFSAEAGSDFTATIIPCPICPGLNNLKISH